MTRRARSLLRFFVAPFLLIPFAAAQTAQTPNTYAGCVIGGNRSIFNTRIDQLPFHSKSALWISHIGAAPLSIAPAWGVNVIDNAMPSRKFRFHYTPDEDHVPFQTPQGPHRRRETGALTSDSNNDHHVIAINRENCHVYETYQDGIVGEGWNAASGYDYLSTSTTLPKSASTDAAGLPLLPLLLHLSEINDGEVRHALRFTSCTGCISNTSFLWPATTPNGSAAPNTPPMGARLRLKASFDLTRFSGKARVVLTALQHYGMFLADNGLSMQIQTGNDCNLDPSVTAALTEISSAHIPAGQFEIVDESALRISPGSSLAKTGGPLRDVIAVGVESPVLILQAGTPALQLHAWANHSTTHATAGSVRWTQTAGPGSLTSSGLYTPPVAVPGAVAVRFLGSSTEDPSAQGEVMGNVIPAGAIRIDTGSLHPYTDRSGKQWLADTLGLDTAAYSTQNDNYPRDAWGNREDAALYATYVYTWGDDIAYPPILLANGTYRIKFFLGHGGCTGKYNPLQTFDNGLVWGPVVLEANATETMFDAGKASDYTCRTGTTSTLQTEVTDNQLHVAIRAMGGEKTHSAPFLNALEIDRIPK